MCLLLGLALVAISLFLYSPWHKHDRFAARQACGLSQFEHASLDGQADHIQLAFPGVSSWAPPSDSVSGSPHSFAARVLGPRAPPAFAL